MSVHDAQPGDIYVDECGKLWRVKFTISDPSVEVEEVEPRFYTEQVGNGVYRMVRQPECRSGAVSGLMWNGFKRIYRHPSGAA